MTITAKIAAALLAIFLALFVCVWGILSHAVQPGFDRLENDAHQRDRARIESNMQAMARDVETRATDYAQWDDTYAYVSRSNPSYIVDNFSDEWFANYDVDVMGVADENGDVLWARAASPDAGEAFGAAAVNAALAQAGAAPETSAVSVGVVWIEGQAWMLAAAHVTSSDGAAAPRGHVVIGRVISAEALSEQMQVNLRLVDPANPPADLAAQMARSERDGSLSWTDRETIKSLIALRAADGEAAGAVLTESARDISALGRRSIGAALGLFALVALLAIGALWVVLQRMVIARVLRLDRHLRVQSTGSTALAQLDAGRSDDEIGRLTGAYNDLAVRLRQAAASEREAISQREAAAGANRMKSAFLANISHELRTPLDTVIGYTELVEEELADRGLATAQEDLRHVLTAARLLADMIGEINDLSRIEAGRMSITLASFDIERMLRDVVTAAQAQARQNGNSFRVDFSASLGSAYSDEFRLQQSLANVLADCFSRNRGAEISFSARRSEDAGQDALHFAVQVAGTVLSEHQLQHMFEPFQAVDASTAFVEGGAGLGLAIAGKVIETIGGRVEARNMPGQGMTIEIVIPVDAPDHAVATARRLRTQENTAA